MLGYRQVVKSADFDSAIVGSNPTTPAILSFRQCPIKSQEVRLNDEKRKKISAGDSIQFVRVSDNKPLPKRIVATGSYESLENLIDSEKLEAPGGIYENTGH